MPDNRLERLKKLKEATLDYVGKEKIRIEAEVEALKLILDGRGSGAGIQTKAWQKTSKAAENDLAAYLKGA